MISMEFVNQMNHSHNQAVYAIRKYYWQGISFNNLSELAQEFIDERTDKNVFLRQLRKMYNARACLIQD